MDPVRELSFRGGRETKGRPQAALAAPRRETPLDPETLTGIDLGGPHAGPSGVGGFQRPAAPAADPRREPCSGAGG